MFNTVGRWKRIKYIALSQTNYEDMKKEYPYCNISCIVNGRARIVPTTLFDKVKREIAKYRTDDNTKVFLHVARCNIQKNQSLLIHAFNEAIAKGVNVQLLIVGAGFDTQEGEKLKNIAEKTFIFWEHGKTSQIICLMLMLFVCLQYTRGCQLHYWKLLWLESRVFRPQFVEVLT